MRDAGITEILTRSRIPRIATSLTPLATITYGSWEGDGSLPLLCALYEQGQGRNSQDVMIFLMSDGKTTVGGTLALSAIIRTLE